MVVMTKKWVLAKKVIGYPKLEDFECITEEIKDCDEGGELITCLLVDLELFEMIFAYSYFCNCSNHPHSFLSHQIFLNNEFPIILINSDDCCFQVLPIFTYYKTDSVQMYLIC